MKISKAYRSIGHDAMTDWVLILMYTAVVIVIFISLALISYRDVSRADRSTASIGANERKSIGSEWQNVLEGDRLAGLIQAISMQRDASVGSVVSVRKDPSL
jgi:hypothetical protein